MKKLALGLQIHSVREAFMAEPEKTLEQVAAMGYDGVEMVLQYCPFDARRYGKALKESGLTCYSMMLDWKYMLSEENFQKTMEYTKTMDCNMIVMAAVPKPELAEVSENPDKAVQLKDTALQYMQRLKEAGFETGYHDHDGDHLTKVSGTESFMNYLLRHTPKEYMYMIDTGNALAGGADPIAQIKAFSGRSRIVHLKGFCQESRYLTPVWRSQIDQDSLLKTLVKDGGAEVLSIEFGTAVEGTAFQQAAQSYVWLRDKLKENGFM